MKKTEEKPICLSHSTDINVLEDIRDNLNKEVKIEDLSQLFKALGDPTRSKIIYALSQSPLCVCDISTLLDMTQSAISHHLRILRGQGLVKFRRKGKLVIYSLDDDHVFTVFKEGLKHVKHD
ncbi:MAG TPA: metalloregulator ArsR/SmtB family transcription factor [Tissierellaceae bacterium]|nr:metalloregulator ArsR/SmtB family transcription factor [Tissierellaceae bacterium]